MQDIYYPEINQTALIMKATFYGTKKVSTLYVFVDKRCYKRIPTFYKNKVYFVDTLSREHIFGIHQSHVDQKVATMLYN